MHVRKQTKRAGSNIPQSTIVHNAKKYKMKRRIIILTTAMVLLTTITNAQKTTVHSGGTTFGIRGGVNFQNINGKDEDGNKLSNDLVTRFNFGVNAEIPVGTDFYFQPGLLFTTKGAKNEQVIPWPGGDQYCKSFLPGTAT